MRTALVAESFFPAVDGTTTTVKAVVDRLVDHGHEVLVIAPAPGLTSYRGCRVARIQSREPVGAQVRAELEAFAPDLVHVTSPDTVGRKALKHAGRLGIRTLIVQQTPVSHLAAERWRTKVADRSDRVLVTPTWMRERLGDLGVDAGLWAPGVDTVAFGPQLRDQWLHASWARASSSGGPASRGRVRRQPAPSPRRAAARGPGAGARHPPGAGRRRPAARLAGRPAARREVHRCRSRPAT